MLTNKEEHPAKFSKAILQKGAELLIRDGVTDITDIFAGVGKICELRKYGWQGYIRTNELEEEWALQCIDAGSDEVVIGDATDLPYEDGSLPCIFTSPVYGNRCSDHHIAKDGSKRITYTHMLGHELSKGSTANKHFGREYCAMHKAIYQEVWRVLEDGKDFYLNTKDFLKTMKRKGKKWQRRVRVTLWHIKCLQSLGFVLEEYHRIETPGMRCGANGKKRVPYEVLMKFRKVAN